MLVGCNKPEAVSGIKTVDYTPSIINIKAHREKTMWEENKCMSGACIDNEYAYETINEFENAADISNDVYIKRYSVGEEFPSSFIIDTYAKGKKPMIILDNVYEIKYIENFAEKCNNIGVPILIEMDYDNLTELYNQSAKIFRKKCPKAGLMWGIDLSYNMSSAPKDEYIDWVVINVNEKTDNNGIVSEITEVRDMIKYFSGKAVALNISIEVFSGINHKYYVNQWNDEIKALYSLANDYANIGLISYTDKSEDNRIYGSSKISDSEKMIIAYADAVNLLPLERNWTSSDKIAYINNNTAYISITAARELGMKEKYVNSHYVATKQYSVDNSERKIFVYNTKM